MPSENPASSIDPPAASPAQHGGKRTPGPGKKIGPKFKDPKKKSVTVSIVLSSDKVAKKLKAKAKRAKLTPGAYIERELNLLPPASTPPLPRHQ
ncbi:MAG: hypothetical protein J0L73_26440 [Verrucomicrobia bacterium]|nr:hypothetical protein [Verrucomicrobiota bacterium]